ncbi:hypothetical protein SAMN00790413_05084 [Deinococcus hopiensis KR-140]|uniref:Uncharacterized protein n=1 Tax=Deinococcus hopiensis KR-140 TaxID=695939 RepID=A0A1W1UTA0_9DEIO|nr:hypothetical protein SAMN00790413_05084 [Deinococcus hopiensis KR-140]
MVFVHFPVNHLNPNGCHASPWPLTFTRSCQIHERKRHLLGVLGGLWSGPHQKLCPEVPAPIYKVTWSAILEALNLKAGIRPKET